MRTLGVAVDVGRERRAARAYGSCDVAAIAGPGDGSTVSRLPAGVRGAMNSLDDAALAATPTVTPLNITSATLGAHLPSQLGSHEPEQDQGTAPVVQLLLDVLQVLVPVRCPSGVDEVHVDAWVGLLHLQPYSFGISGLDLVAADDEDRDRAHRSCRRVVVGREGLLFCADGLVTTRQLKAPFFRQAVATDSPQDPRCRIKGFTVTALGLRCVAMEEIPQS